MLYIVYTSYKPNQAPTNRVLAILKGLDEQGVKARFVLLYPSSGADRVEADKFKNFVMRTQKIERSPIMR